MGIGEKDTFDWFEHNDECPRCHKVLDRDTEVIKIDICSSGGLDKLWGLHPDEALQIFKSSMTFHLYQV